MTLEPNGVVSSITAIGMVLPVQISPIYPHRGLHSEVTLTLTL